MDMKKYPSGRQAKEDIIEIGKRMYMRGFVAANDGNISVKTGKNEIWVTPTGVSKGFMTPEMMVRLDMSGKMLEGTHKPSSEIKLHIRAYRENPEIGAVVHAHPPAATSFAVAGVPLDAAVLQEAVVQLGTVPVAEYAVPGTEGVADSVAAFFNTHNGALLANHGALSWGADVFQAFFRLESMEYYATILLNTAIIGKRRELTNAQIDELIKIRKKLGITAGGRPVSKA